MLLTGHFQRPDITTSANGTIMPSSGRLWWAAVALSSMTMLNIHATASPVPTPSSSPPLHQTHASFQGTHFAALSTDAPRPADALTPRQAKTRNQFLAALDLASPARFRKRINHLASPMSRDFAQDSPLSIPKGLLLGSPVADRNFAAFLRINADKRDALDAVEIPAGKVFPYYLYFGYGVAEKARAKMGRILDRLAAVPPPFASLPGHSDTHNETPIQNPLDWPVSPEIDATLYSLTRAEFLKHSSTLPLLVLRPELRWYVRLPPAHAPKFLAWCIWMYARATSAVSENSSDETRHVIHILPQSSKWRFLSLGKTINDVAQACRTLMLWAAEQPGFAAAFTELTDRKYQRRKRIHMPGIDYTAEGAISQLMRDSYAVDHRPVASIAQYTQDPALALQVGRLAHLPVGTDDLAALAAWQHVEAIRKETARQLGEYGKAHFAWEDATDSIAQTWTA